MSSLSNTRTVRKRRRVLYAVQGGGHSWPGGSRYRNGWSARQATALTRLARCGRSFAGMGFRGSSRAVRRTDYADDSNPIRRPERHRLAAGCAPLPLPPSAICSTLHMVGGSLTSATRLGSTSSGQHSPSSILSPLFSSSTGGSRACISLCSSSLSTCSSMWPWGWANGFSLVASHLGALHSGAGRRLHMGNRPHALACGQTGRDPGRSGTVS